MDVIQDKRVNQTLTKLKRLAKKSIHDSKEEKAIRAATILACEELAIKTGAKPAEIDFWLWSRRNTADKPFHLTYTTAY